MADTFFEVIQNFEKKAINEVDKVFKNSVKDILEEFTTSNMPVRTGYLRQSHEVSTESMPLVDSKSVPADSETLNQYELDNSKSIAKINAIEKPKDIYVGFTAAYAGTQEIYRAYIRLPVQNWNAIVEKNINANK